MNSTPIDYKFRPRKKHKKATLKDMTERTIRSLVITLTLMIATLAIINIVLTTSTSQKGYTLEQQELQNQELRTQSERLTTKLTDATTSEEIESNSLLSSMEENLEKTYVNKEDNMVN